LARAGVAVAEELVQALTKGLLLLLFLGRGRRERKLVVRCRGEGIIKGLLLLLRCCACWSPGRPGVEGREEDEALWLNEMLTG
jgi:hypothetical protein